MDDMFRAKRSCDRRDELQSALHRMMRHPLIAEEAAEWKCH
jgi:hypothetical protein